MTFFIVLLLPTGVWALRLKSCPLGFIGFRVNPLVVEICCRENSCIGSVCEKMQIPHRGISEEIDIKKPNAALFVRQLLDHRGDIMFWIASPCTAGCRLRHIRLHYPKHFHTWQKNFKIQIWRSLNSIFEGKQELRRCWIFQEWPVGCDLWLDTYYCKIQKRLHLDFEAEVNRCCSDDIRKDLED